MNAESRRQADVLVTDIDWLITVDARRRVIRDAGIAIVAGRFAAVGKSDAIVREWRAERIVSGRNRVATPGFIDNHLHSSFHLSRGLADEANAQSFLFDHMYPYEGAMSEDDVHVSALLATLELLRHGVTCFVDPGNYHPEATVAAARESGIRVVISRSSFDRTKSVMGLLPAAMIESTEQCIETTGLLLERYAGGGDPRVRAAASFRGLNNSSDALILGLKELADRFRCPLQTHACFGYSTHDGCLASFGRPEIERLEALGVLDDRMILVHGGWLEPHEVALVARRHPTVVAAPSSSMHNGYGNFVMGKLPELLALGVNVSIGSDHASSGIVDMPQEMRLLADGYKEVRINPRVMPPETVVEMATRNGAIGVGLGDELGSVEDGKRADLVLFDTRRPEWQPLYNPVSNLVYAATGDSIVDVFVDGEQVVRDGRLARLDEEAIFRQVEATAKRIAGRVDLKRIVKLLWPVE